MRSHRPLIAALILALLGAAPVVVRAQANAAPEITAQQAKVLMQQAFMKSKSADNLAGFQEVVELSSKALTGPLSDENRLYAKTLLAWGHNRSGEHFIAEADDAAARKDTAAAADFQKRAMTSFDAAIAADATNHQAWFNRAALRAQLGKRDEALADLDQAVAVKPDFGDAWFNRGQLHADRGDVAKGVADFSQAIRVAPQDFGAYLGRASVLARQGKFDEAIRDCDAAVKVAPKNPAVYTQRGDIQHDLGKWNEALADYRRAIEFDSRYGAAHVGLAWILATCPDDAIRQGDAALSAAKRGVVYLGTSDWRALDAQAAAEASLGKFSEAKATLQKALAAAPADAAERLRKRLQLYEQGKPFRESPRAE